MSATSPPRFASWLLYRQVRGYHADALAGDLLEEYENRGARWFWSQVLLAVAGSYARVLRLYGLRFLGAVTAGWMVLFAGNLLLGRMWAALQYELQFDFAAQGLQGSRLLYHAARILLAGGVDVFVGRLVVRIYRPQPKLMAGSFALTILLYMLPSIYRLFTAAIAGSAGFALFEQQLMATLIWMSGAWFGGLWQIRVDERAPKVR